MSQTAPPPLQPLQGSARLWGTLALSAATFMNVLDSSIANVSLPAIAGDLGVSPNQGTWVITSFGVANAIAALQQRPLLKNGTSTVDDFFNGMVGEFAVLVF